MRQWKPGRGKQHEEATVGFYASMCFKTRLRVRKGFEKRGYVLKKTEINYEDCIDFSGKICDQAEKCVHVGAFELSLDRMLPSYIYACYKLSRFLLLYLHILYLNPYKIGTESS